MKSDQHERAVASGTANDSANPIFWEPSLAYVKIASTILLTGALVFMLVIRITAPEQTTRYFGPLLAVLVSLGTLGLVWRGRVQAAVYMLAAGAWLTITATAAYVGGVRSVVVYAYPVSIILIGWLIGTRAALTVSGLTVAALAGFALAEASGVLPPQPPTSALMFAVVQILIVTLATALIVYLVRAYGNRHADVTQMGDALALRTAELEARTVELHRAQAIAKTGSWVADYANGTVRLSAEACRIFGVPEGTPGNHAAYLSRVDPADRVHAESKREAALKSGAGLEPHEVRIQVHGETRWIHQTAEYELAPDGKVLRAVGTVQDITERKLAEAALQESEQRYRTLLEWTPEAVAVHREGLVIYVNPAAVTMMGAASAQDLIGRPIIDSVHPDYRELVLARVRQAGAQGLATPLMEEKFIKLDGASIDVEVQTTPIVYDGKPAIHVAMRDITARKSAEKALRVSDEIFAKAFQSSPLLISITTRAEGRYININDAFLRLLGHARDEVVGKTSADIRIWKTPADRQRTIDGLATSRPTTGIEVELRKKTGEIVFCEVRGAPIDINGAACLIMVTSDITERKAAEATRTSLEAQLRESQKMQAIGTLAGGIAHDFNNIIATILGNTELARQDAGANAPLLESLEEIRKSSARARDLVQQILSFSRREPTRRRVLALAPVVEESVRLLRATLPARISIEAHCNADVPSVLADRTQIEQVLINLATNAMQAMRDAPGRVNIRLDCVILDAALAKAQPVLHDLLTRHPGRSVRLAVSDTGPGMDAATLARIFEPFFTTKPVGEGTGLGLSVVHGIAQAHEGVIVVNSTLGQGTTFALYLPIAQIPEPMQERGHGAATSGVATPVGAGRQILYVDDDAALVFLVKRLLERRGIRVMAHTSQRAALDALRANPAGFDLVLTDYNMPEMSGLDVARAVRQIRADLPVVVATGFIDETLRAQAAGAGVREVIFKASAAEDFCSAIAALLPGKN